MLNRVHRRSVRLARRCRVALSCYPLGEMGDATAEGRGARDSIAAPDAGDPFHNWSRSVILYAIVAVVLLVAVAVGYETIREAHDRSTYAMPGQLFDVGGHRLHITCMGSGTPTVILEAGLGEPGVMMSGWIQPGVATATRVCVYDRAGKGWSEHARSPQRER